MLRGLLKRERIILICGPDGAGKTTLASMLARHYNRHGKRAIICRIRGTHTLASLVAKFLARFEKFRGHDIPFFNVRIPLSLRRLWFYLEVISIVPHLVAYIIIYPLLGYLVVLERSLVDFVTWVLFVLKDPRILNNILIKSMLLFSYRSKSVFLKADINALVSRKKDEKYLILGMSGIYELLSVYTRCKIDTMLNNKKTTYLEALKCIKLNPRR